MNRHKFRFWLRDSKKWVVMSKDPQLAYEFLVMNYYNLFEGRNIVPNQWVGVKDIRCVDIYEHDLVEYYDHNRIKTIGEVFFNKEELSYELTRPGYEPYRLSFIMKKSQVRVIGNIYETPDLLKL